MGSVKKAIYDYSVGIFTGLVGGLIVYLSTVKQQILPWISVGLLVVGFIPVLIAYLLLKK